MRELQQALNTRVPSQTGTDQQFTFFKLFNGISMGGNKFNNLVLVSLNYIYPIVHIKEKQ